MFGGEDGVDEVDRGVGEFMRTESICELKRILKSIYPLDSESGATISRDELFTSIPLFLRRCFMKAISSNFSSYVRIRSITRRDQ